MRTPLDIEATDLVLCAVRSEAEGERRKPKGSAKTAAKHQAWGPRRSLQSASRPVGAETIIARP
jgi:hypothetical protein